MAYPLNMNRLAFILVVVVSLCLSPCHLHPSPYGDDKQSTTTNEDGIEGPIFSQFSSLGQSLKSATAKDDAGARGISSTIAPSIGVVVDQKQSNVGDAQRKISAPQPSVAAPQVAPPTADYDQPIDYAAAARPMVNPVLPSAPAPSQQISYEQLPEVPQLDYGQPEVNPPQPTYGQPQVTSQPPLKVTLHSPPLQPVYVQPEVQQPICYHPEIVSPTPIIPLAPSQPAYVQPEILQPVYVQPEVQQPVYVQPEIPQPVYVQSEVQQPIYVQPAVQQPVYVQPEVQQPTYVQTEPTPPQPAYVQPAAPAPTYSQPQAAPLPAYIGPIPYQQAQGQTQPELQPPQSNVMALSYDIGSPAAAPLPQPNIRTMVPLFSPPDTLTYGQLHGISRAPAQDQKVGKVIIAQDNYRIGGGSGSPPSAVVEYNQNYPSYNRQPDVTADVLDVRTQPQVLIPSAPVIQNSNYGGQLNQQVRGSYGSNQGPIQPQSQSNSYGNNQAVPQAPSQSSYGDQFDFDPNSNRAPVPFTMQAPSQGSYGGNNEILPQRPIQQQQQEQEEAEGAGYEGQFDVNVESYVGNQNGNAQAPPPTYGNFDAGGGFQRPRSRGRGGYGK